jgi:hypothetical protein
MRGTHLRWGSVGSAIDATGETAGSLVDAILFLDYLFVWSLTMAAYIGVYILAAVATLLLVLVCLPCFLWRKVLPKDKSQRSGHGPKARLLG